MCRVGDGRSALVAAQEEGHPSARAGSLLHVLRRPLREEGGRAAGSAYHPAWRTYHHGAGGERVWQLRRGQGLHLRHPRHAPQVLGHVRRQDHALPVRLELQLREERTGRPYMDDELRNRCQHRRPVPPSARASSQRSVDVFRVLERMVRQVGSPPRDPSCQGYGRRNGRDAIKGHFLLALHDSRRHVVRSLGWCQLARIRPRRNVLRL